MKTVTNVTLPLVLAVAACSGTPEASSHRVEPAPPGSGSLAIEVAGLRNNDGSVSVSLFRSAQGFPQDTALVFRSATIGLAENPDAVVRIQDLDFGDYAVSVLHDENANRELDTSFLGMPTEGFGFSNNPRIGFGAPSFESCRFRFAATELTLRVQMRYF